jgi:hypothetical protein
MAKAKKLPASVRKAMDAAGVSVPQVAELVGHFMQLSGGPQLFAKMLFEEFLRAPEGSIMRQRILESVLRMMAIANQQMGEIKETDLISQEDLERELQELMSKVPDGEEEAPEPGGEGAAGPGGAPAARQAKEGRRARRASPPAAGGAGPDGEDA